VRNKHRAINIEITRNWLAKRLLRVGYTADNLQIFNMIYTLKAFFKNIIL